jgi:hypothetical protein
MTRGRDAGQDIIRARFVDDITFAGDEILYRLGRWRWRWKVVFSRRRNGTFLLDVC